MTSRRPLWNSATTMLDESEIHPDDKEEVPEGYSTTRDAAYTFLASCGLRSTPDAISQLSEVFLPCLKIMCERPWDPNGGTWQAAGRMGALADIRKKFQRLWYRAWTIGKRHDDSAYDLINYIGFFLRADHPGWGDWGEPAHIEAEDFDVAAD